MDFIHESGIPAWLVVDNAPEQKHARWNKIQREFHIRQTNTEPYSPWQNHAEGEIRELKKMIKHLTLRCHSPKRVWCFAGELAAAIQRLTASDRPLLRGRVPHEVVHGDTPDISEYCQFDWYDWVYWCDNDGEQQIGWSLDWCCSQSWRPDGSLDPTRIIRIMPPNCSIDGLCYAACRLREHC